MLAANIVIYVTLASYSLKNKSQRAALKNLILTFFCRFSSFHSFALPLIAFLFSELGLEEANTKDDLA